jgi:hypothetical protein
MGDREQVTDVRRRAFRIRPGVQYVALVPSSTRRGIRENSPPGSGGVGGGQLCLQILTIAELLEGKKLEYPAHRVETFAKAERKTKTEQDELF